MRDRRPNHCPEYVYVLRDRLIEQAGDSSVCDYTFCTPGTPKGPLPEADQAKSDDLVPIGVGGRCTTRGSARIADEPGASAGSGDIARGENDDGAIAAST